MNFDETVKLLSALRAAGVKHFKSPEFEIHLDGNPRSVPESSPISAPYISVPSSEPVGHTSPPTAYNPQATKKVEDLVQTLRLDDNELLNKIFPAGAEE